jgi:hypothetical protein
MSANDDSYENAAAESPLLSESGTMLDYLWNVPSEGTLDGASEVVQPAQAAPEKCPMSSTSIFRFTLAEYRDWLKSLEPK